MTDARRPSSLNGGHRSRCLLLVPRGHDVPLDLLEGLTRRKVAVREVHDAPAVMVALADESPRRPRAVVVVHPRAMAAADPLVRAMRQYHDDVAIWRYDATEEPALHAWPDEPQPATSVTTDEAADADEPVNATDEQLTSNDVTEDDLPTEAERLALDDDADDSQLLTDEELAMLLGDDDLTDTQKG